MKNVVNQTIRAIGIPVRMRNRPVARNGFPVPFFVTTKDKEGEWDFRATERKTYVDAHNRQVCWVCGQLLGRYRTFVIGPMCAVNRTTSEPPCHRDCAEWSARVCPFMVNPRMRRNTVDVPDGYGELKVGIPLERNPGVIMLWHTERGKYRAFTVKNGFMYRLEVDPVDVGWYSHGGPASREEVMASVNSGLPALWRVAKLDGPEAEKLLTVYIATAHEKFFDRIPEVLHLDVRGTPPIERVE